MPSPSTHQEDSPKVPESVVESLAEMRWDEARESPGSPAWDELTGCEDMKRRRCDEARDDLEELAPFLFSALLSDEAKAAAAEALRVAPVTTVVEKKSELLPPYAGEITWPELAEIALTAAIEHVGGAK